VLTRRPQPRSFFRSRTESEWVAGRCSSPLNRSAKRMVAEAPDRYRPAGFILVIAAVAGGIAGAYVVRLLMSGD